MNKSSAECCMAIVKTNRQLFVCLHHKMRDFTSREYCDFLWINDLLSLEKKHNNNFRAILNRRGEEKITSISKVTIFGTIVEIKKIGEKGILYYVDDGTGVIVCKYNEIIFSQVFDVIQSEQGSILNETFSCQSMINESQFEHSIDENDTIFNDLSLQEEEATAVKRNRLKALHSIWTDIEDSFSSMIGELNIGDSVLVQGKLFSYFNSNQIYVNTIRLIDRKEELILMIIKHEDGYEPCRKTGKSDQTQPIQLIENSRKSGVMTFDHIHHLETSEMNTCKIIVKKENSDDYDIARRRRSIVLPNLQGSMTFDTLTDLNASKPIKKTEKIDTVCQMHDEY